MFCRALVCRQASEKSHDGGLVNFHWLVIGWYWWLHLLIRVNRSVLGWEHIWRTLWPQGSHSIVDLLFFWRVFTDFANFLTSFWSDMELCVISCWLYLNGDLRADAGLSDVSPTAKEELQSMQMSELMKLSEEDLESKCYSGHRRCTWPRFFQKF